MKVGDVRDFLRALRQTGALDPHPVHAALTLLLDVVRHGPSLYAVVRWQARRHPDAPAIASGGETLTYRALLERAEAVAADLHAAHPALRSVGIVDADPLGTLLALLACGRLGWHAVPITSRLGADGVRAVQMGAGLDFLLCPDVLLDEYPGAHPIRPALHPPAPRRRARGGQLGLLTSGSTARPRVIRRDLRTITPLSAVTALLTTLPLRAGMGAVLPLPVSHGHGLTFLSVCLFLGARVRLLHAPTPGQVWGAVHEPGAEVVTLVPTQLHRLMTDPWPRPAGLRGLLCGSGPLDPGLARRTLAHLGPVLFNQYGTTETGPLTLATPTDLTEAPGSVGRPLPGVKLDVQGGHIRLQTHQGPVGTGDLGAWDDQGRLVLQGRADDLLICGGENLHPAALEARLRELPYVQDCAVQGLPNPEYGQAIRAFLVLDAPGDLARFRTDCDALLPRAHRPREVHVVHALPRNAVGKLIRRELTALLPESPRDEVMTARSPA